VLAGINPLAARRAVCAAPLLADQEGVISVMFS